MLRLRTGLHAARALVRAMVICVSGGLATILDHPASSSTMDASTSPTIRKHAPARQMRSLPHSASDVQPGSSGSPRTQADAPRTTGITMRATAMRLRRMLEAEQRKLDA